MILNDLITTLDFNKSQIKSIGLYRPSKPEDHTSNDTVLITKTGEATPADILTYAHVTVLSWTAGVFDGSLSSESFHGNRYIRLMVTLDL